MSFIPKALPFLATGLSAVGSYVGGQQSHDQLKMQSIVASQQALADESTQRRENRALRGEQAAVLAENGLSPGGSSAAMADQDAALAELDALNIRYQGLNRAKSLRSQAKNAKSTGGLLAGAQLLTGASDEWARRRMEKY